MTRADASANKRTVASYEECAVDYARSTAPSPTTCWLPHEKFAAALPSREIVLEIGSGPGYDADWLERLGIEVRRTDATRAFVDLQKARGAAAEVLDVVADPLGGPYAGILAMYVFQHIERHLLPRVFANIADALEMDGAFLFSIRDGDGDAVEERSSGGSYYIAEWNKVDLDIILGKLGLHERWSRSSVDEEGRWITMLTVKTSTA